MKIGVTSTLNKLALELPYFVIRKTFSAFTLKRQNELWSKSPFKHLVSPVELPDGNRILWCWEEDAFWLRDMIKEIYEDQVYEHFFKVEKGDVVVDVGGNIGIFTLKASKKVGEGGKIVTFEPEIRNFRRLSRNIRINKCNNVVPLNMALSDFDGKSHFYIKDVGVEHTLLPRTTMQSATHTVKTAEVDVRKLLSVLRYLGVHKVDFLKIDAEGSELEVLKGSEELLQDKKIRRISVAAYHNKQEAGIISDYLLKAKYDVRSLRTEGLANFAKEHVFATS